MRIYIVQKGDTLFKIAKKHKVSVEDITRLNAHIANPDYIVPGMKIRLPKHTVKEEVEEKDSLESKADTNRTARTNERPLGSVAKMEDRGGGDLQSRVPLNTELGDMMRVRREKESYKKEKTPRKQSKSAQEDSDIAKQISPLKQSHSQRGRMPVYSQEVAEQMREEWPPFYMDPRQPPLCPCCMYHWHMHQMMLEYEQGESYRKRCPTY